MSTESIVDKSVKTFQHRTVEGGCSCPIHRNQTREPFTAPLGMRFAEDVTVSPISQAQAQNIYEAHHGYMDGDLHPACLDHHGLKYQGNTVGAITYRHPLMSLKRLHFCEDGTLMQEPLSESDFEELPDEIRPTARELLSPISEAEVGHSKVIQGDKFVEANRICVGVDMANLASCSLAKSQEQFVQSSACPDQTEFLVTYVVASFPGSMIRALRDKGWTCVGWSEPSTASNREERPIQHQYKWCFLCPIEEVVPQCSLAIFL